MLEQLQEFINTCPDKIVTQRLRSKKYKDLYEWVVENSSHMGEISLREKIYRLLNPDVQLVCDRGNPYKFKALSSGFGFCGTMSECACHQVHVNRCSHAAASIADREASRLATLETKYGVTNPLKVPGAKEKRQNTLASNDYSKSYAAVKKQNLLTGYNQVIERLRGTVIPNFSSDEYYGVDSKYKYSWTCEACQYVFDYHVDFGTVPKCPKCFPSNISKGHRWICDLLDELGIAYDINTRTVISPLELDVWIPSMNIAIEFNGVYWHSDKFKTPSAHADKWKTCLDAGIKLIQIFEDEWVNKPEVIRNRLISILGRGKRTYARKCEVREITSDDYVKFCDTHHLKGSAQAKYKYGLYFSNELVAVMSFGVNRYEKDHAGYELIRYCSDGNVIGGASKLFKHFLRTVRPSYVMSYADRCWGSGEVYRKIGFRDVTMNMRNSGYSWVKDNIRFHRSSFTKKRLVELGYDATKTETQIMTECGYMKVFDAGNLKFEWRSP